MDIFVTYFRNREGKLFKIFMNTKTFEVTIYPMDSI